MDSESAAVGQLPERKVVPELTITNEESPRTQDPQLNPSHAAQDVPESSDESVNPGIATEPGQGLQNSGGRTSDVANAANTNIGPITDSVRSNKSKSALSARANPARLIPAEDALEMPKPIYTPRPTTPVYEDLMAFPDCSPLRDGEQSWLDDMDVFELRPGSYCSRGYIIHADNCEIELRKTNGATYDAFVDGGNEPVARFRAQDAKDGKDLTVRTVECPIGRRIINAATKPMEDRKNFRKYTSHLITKTGAKALHRSGRLVPEALGPMEDAAGNIIASNAKEQNCWSETPVKVEFNPRARSIDKIAMMDWAIALADDCPGCIWVLACFVCRLLPLATIAAILILTNKGSSSEGSTNSTAINQTLLDQFWNITMWTSTQQP